MYNPRTNAHFKQINAAREVSRCNTCKSYYCHCQLSLEDWLKDEY